MFARTTFFAGLLAATVSQAQVVKPVAVQPVRPAEPTAPSNPAPGFFDSTREERTGTGAYGSFKIIYERDSARRTQLRFATPEPLSIRVLDGNAEVLRDTIPTKLDAKPGRLYRVQISNGREVVFDQSFEAKSEMVGELSVTLPPKPVAVLPTVSTTGPSPIVAAVPARPSPVYPAASGKPECMNTNVLKPFTGYVEQANSSEDKLWFVRDLTKRKSYYFCVSQVFTTLKLFEAPKDRLQALAHIAPLIVDKKNNFKVPALFQSNDDRDEARRILTAAQ